MKDNKIITAKASFVRTSPRKLRLVARAVSSFSPEKAVEYLKVINKRAAKPLLLVMQQAIANAKNNFAANPGTLTIESLQVLEGPRGPKRTDKAHGARFDRGVKRRRMAHILVKLIIKEK